MDSSTGGWTGSLGACSRWVIGQGDHVGLWAPNVPDWLTFLFATAKIGAPLVTVNTQYRARELAYVVKQSDMRPLVLADRFLGVSYVDVVGELIPDLARQDARNLAASDFPKLRNLICLGTERRQGMTSSAELLIAGSHYPAEALGDASSRLHCDDVVNLQYTSGTTGFPRGAMLTHRNILNNGYYVGEAERLTRRTGSACRCPSSTASALSWRCWRC